jgi:hypothetical protein
MRRLGEELVLVPLSRRPRALKKQRGDPKAAPAITRRLDRSRRFDRREWDVGECADAFNQPCGARVVRLAAIDKSAPHIVFSDHESAHLKREPLARDGYMRKNLIDQRVHPSVKTNAADPVQIGLVASLNRPGGNVTSITAMNVELGAKRLGLLHELVPEATRFAALVDPNFPAAESIIADLRAAAATIGRQIEVLYAGADRDLEAAFASLAQNRIDALVVSPAPNLDPVKLVTLAARHAVPAIYAQRADADAGGLLSYGSLPNWRAPQQTGEGAGKIPAGSPLIRSLRGRWLQPHPDLAKDYERTRLLPLT